MLHIQLLLTEGKRLVETEFRTQQKQTTPLKKKQLLNVHLHIRAHTFGAFRSEVLKELDRNRSGNTSVTTSEDLIPTKYAWYLIILEALIKRLPPPLMFGSSKSTIPRKQLCSMLPLHNEVTTTVLQREGNISKVKQGSGCSQDISQISGPDGKSKLTPLSQIGFRDPASVGGGQQLTLLSIEDTNDLFLTLSQPWLAEDDDHIRDAHVLVRSDTEGVQRNIDGTTGCKVLVSSEEKHLFNHFIKIISSYDPDILVGWDIQDKGIVKNDLPETLMADSVLIEDAIIEDEWGRTQAGGVHVGGRVVLNVWWLMRGEINRTSELARVFGIDFFSVLSRGSQYRVESMLLRLAHTQNYLAISPGAQQDFC
ncbi:hypothetical protein LguiB_021018 [Lonicera macranthoides]